MERSLIRALKIQFLLRISLTRSKADPRARLSEL
jgi:hypothetical protein